MAVTEAQQISASASFPVGGGRSYTVSYQVKTDDRQDGPLTVALSPLLPDQNATYVYGNDSDEGAMRVALPSVKLKSQKGTMKLWMVDVSYATPQSSIVGAKVPRVDETRTTTSPGVDLPWDVPSKVSGSFVSDQEDVYQDRNGDPFRNTASGFFPTNPTVDKSRPSLRISKAYAPGKFSLYTVNDFMNTLNSKTFFGLPPETWRLVDASWDQLYMSYNSRQYAYYQIDYEFAADLKDKWKWKPIDQGFLDLLNKPPTDSRNISIDGMAWALDGNGFFIDLVTTPNETFYFFDGSTSVLQPFDLYETRDFSLLGVPTQLP